MNFDDQCSLNAYVSMIMVNLPFPPLPVVSTDADGNDKIGSGHDLLSRAIAATIIGPQTSSMDVATNVSERKQNLLRSMHERIAQAWARTDLTETDKLDECYKHFCTVFRAYMRLYPGPDDLRILPLSMVDGDSIVCKQAVKHLDARSSLSKNPTEGEETVDVAEQIPVWSGMRYHELIRAYAEDLYQVSLVM